VPWLFATARGALANRHRAARRRRALTAKLAAQTSWTNDHPSDLSEVDRRLLDAVAKLPDAEREAFLLVAWDGLDGSRAARAAGCTAATFRMRLHRARRRLRREIAPLHAPTPPVDARSSLEDPR
jgi:RNA polymerase sigma factor (sigma-70 family)